MSGSGSVAIEAGTGTVVGRSLLARKIVHVQDVQADPDYTLARAGGLGSFRTVLAVPMLLVFATGASVHLPVSACSVPEATTCTT